MVKQRQIRNTVREHYRYIVTIGGRAVCTDLYDVAAIIEGGLGVDLRPDASPIRLRFAVVYWQYTI